MPDYYQCAGCAGLFNGGELQIRQYYTLETGRTAYTVLCPDCVERLEEILVPDHIEEEIEIDA